MTVGTEDPASRSDDTGNEGGGGRARWIYRHPLLAVAMLSLLVLHGVPLVFEDFTVGVPGVLWAGAVVALKPFSFLATWVDPFLRGFPEPVDWIATLILGLTPYVVGDALYRRFAFGRMVKPTPTGFSASGSP